MVKTGYWQVFYWLVNEQEGDGCGGEFRIFYLSSMSGEGWDQNYVEAHVRAGGSLVEVWTTQPENSKPNQQLVICEQVPGIHAKPIKKKTKTDGIETTNGNRLRNPGI